MTSAPPAPYVARSPDDVHYNTPSKFMTYATFATNLAVSSSVAYAAAVAADAPVCYLRFSETGVVTTPSPFIATNLGTVGAAGNGVAAVTNYGISTSIAGSQPGALADAANTAFSFPGTDTNRINVPYRPEWNVSTPFSVELWLKGGTNFSCPASSVQWEGAGWLIYQGDSTQTNSNSGNGWWFRVYNSSGGRINAQVDMSVSPTAWYHVVGVYNGTSALLYTNGALAASAALGGAYAPNPSTTNLLTLGGRSNGGSRPYGGLMDEAAFYTNALTPSQIAAHYAAATTNAAGYATSILNLHPAGYWRFNELLNPPVAANSSSGGSAFNGAYLDWSATVPDLQAPAYPGLEPTNTVLQLFGTNGQVLIPPLDLNTNTVTFECWLKRNGNQPSYAGVLMHRTSAGSGACGLGFHAGSNHLGYGWNDAANTYNWDSGLLPPDGQWTYAALTISPAQAVISMFDGTTWSAATNPVSHAVQAFTGLTRVGSDGGLSGRWFNGSLDEAAIYNTALTQTQLRAHALSGFGVTNLTFRLVGAASGPGQSLGTHLAGGHALFRHQRDGALDGGEWRDAALLRGADQSGDAKLLLQGGISLGRFRRHGCGQSSADLQSISISRNRPALRRFNAETQRIAEERRGKGYFAYLCVTPQCKSKGSLILSKILRCEFIELLDAGLARCQKGCDDGAAMGGEEIAMGAGDLTQPAVRPQQGQATGEAVGATAPLQLRNLLVPKEASLEVPIAQTGDGEVGATDRLQQCGVCWGPGIKPPIASALPAPGAADFGGTFRQRGSPARRGQSRQVAAIDRQRDLRPARPIGHTAAQHAPPFWPLGLSFGAAKGAKLLGPVGRSFNPEHIAYRGVSLVVHLDRVAVDAVFGAHALLAALNVADDLTGEMAGHLSRLGGHPASQVAHHVGAAKGGDGVANPLRIKTGQGSRVAKDQVGGVLALRDRPVVTQLQGATKLPAQRVELFEQPGQGLGPVPMHLGVEQGLGSRPVLDLHQTVALAPIGQTLAIQLAAEPFPTIEANINLEGEPGLEPQMHQPEVRVETVEVKMQALTGLQRQAQQVVGVAAVHAEGFAGLYPSQQGDGAAGQSLRGGYLAGQRFLILLVTGKVVVGTPQFRRPGFGSRANALAGLAHKRFEVQQPHVAPGEITLHDRGVIERAQGAAQPQAVVAGEMTNDTRTISV